jgi:hypothetical protein
MLPTDESGFLGKSSGFENRGAEELVMDGPADTSVRPCPPELLKSSLAQRERIARWENWDDSAENGSS